MKRPLAHALRQTKFSRGLSLVELLVAIVLTGLITVAAIALYSSSAATYRTVDASQELQQRARFIFEVVSQAARMTGYEDKIGRLGNRGTPTDASFAGKAFLPFGAIPPVRGFNNAYIPSDKTLEVDYDGVHDNAIAGLHFSDTIAFRYFGSGLLTAGSKPDGSVVNCRGGRHGYPAGAAWGDIPVSLFSLGLSNGAPELYCIAFKVKATGEMEERTRDTIARGVESFQVVYAMDTDVDELKLPSVWRQAHEITAAADWAKVRWIKVGLVLRGEPGSAQSAQDDNLFPLGKEFIGTHTDPGLIFVPSTAQKNDGRLRKAFSTTIQIRNPL